MSTAAAAHEVGPQRGSRCHYVVLGVLAVVCLLPVVMMVLVSFKTEAQIFDTRWSWLFMPTMDNYRSVIQDGHIDRYLLNSIKISVASTLITLMLGTMCAYAMARFRFLGREPLGYATLLLRNLPPAVLAVPVFVLWSAWGIADTLSGVVLVYVALNLPFTIWLLYGFIDQLPIELEEAAAIDGCGPFRVFWRIVLPLLKPAWPRQRSSPSAGLERVHSELHPYQPGHTHAARVDLQLHHRHRRGVGKDHGRRRADRPAAPDLHVRRGQADHHRADGRCGEG